ncbi:MAG: hypothetical protein DI640_09675 [Sphingomonas taxi]|uniref:Uncharacterized protein n=1 Tax=Sphingomonas taxi TaxID=1549858 RepID=A0A2W4Z0M3_9SPHN|nr:MAG: hypothetical protein DI640_09675 [Sphingomonas taxi]
MGVLENATFRRKAPRYRRNRHSRGGGNPYRQSFRLGCWRLSIWIPACAGMTRNWLPVAQI